MKSNFVATVLVAVLMVSAVATVGLCYWYVRVLVYAQALQAQGQTLQRQLGVASRNNEIVRAMASDALEYSKRNPAIDPLLQQLDLKPKPSAGAPAKPATR
jgi:hypothetical protein